MKRPIRVSWRQLGVAALTLMVLSGTIAGLTVHRETVKSVAAVRIESRIDATGFVQAAEALVNAEARNAWVSVSARQSFERAVEMILLGSAAYVQLVHSNAIVVDSVDESFDGTIPLRLSGSSALEDSVTIASRQGHLLADVIVPISSSPDSYARVGYALEALDDYLQAIRLAGAGLAAASFLASCVLLLMMLLWLDIRGHLLTPFHGIIHSISSVHTSGPLILDDRKKQVSLHGRTLFLPPKPFQLLALLIREQGRVLCEAEIVQTLWPDAELADSRDVRQCIYLLRKKLDTILDGAGACVANVKGFGYQFDPEPLEELVMKLKPETAVSS